MPRGPGRDGRPYRRAKERVRRTQAAPDTVEPISIDDVVGIFDGPDSVEWLREQRGQEGP